MTDETPPTGPDRPRGEREQDERPGGRGHSGAAEGRSSEGQGDHPGNGADETRDGTGGTRRGPVAHCGFCRRVLPEQTGRARRYEYCPPGTGLFEDIPDAGTCKELAAAQRRLRAARGTDVVPGAEFEQLSEQVAAAQQLLGPASPVVQLLGGLTGTLTGVGERLDTTVADTLADNTRLTAEAREDRGEKEAMRIERDAANGLAQQEVLARQRTERDSDRRVRAADDRTSAAEAGQRRAELDKATAQGERNLYQERAERAEEAAGRDRATLNEANTKITTLTTTVENLGTQLDDARAEVDRVRAESARTLQEVRDATDLQLAKAQADFAHELAAAAAASTAEIGRQAAEHAETLRQRDREHAADLAHHHQTASDAQHHLERHLDLLRAGIRRLTRASDRRRDTDPIDQAQHLRDGLADLLTDLDDHLPAAGGQPAPPNDAPPQDPTPQPGTGAGPTDKDQR